VAAVRPTDLLKVAPWPALLERNTPGHTATQAPLLIAQGTNDERVAPASNRSMAARLCRTGDKVQLRPYPTSTTWGSSTPPAMTCWPGSATDWPARPTHMPSLKAPRRRMELTT
jgi:hypothetical protein